MLGKTANGLYWMYRYFERAENTARLIETGQRIALTRSGDSDDEWGSILQTVGTLGAYKEACGEVSRDAAIDWMLRGPDNPSSVLATISAARQNARMVRTAVTPEVWEAMNRCYMDTREVLRRKVSDRDLPAVLDKVRRHSALIRGATHGTMLRNDIYDFARIGTFLERADNTARILDVKYYVLLPTALQVGSSLDNLQWETILRSVSATGGFRMVHGNRATPREIVQFLVLDRRMPRSLHFCISNLHGNLAYLAADYGERLTSQEMIETLKNEFSTEDVDAIFEFGLHEYLQRVLASLGQLGQQIEIDYRFYE